MTSENSEYVPVIESWDTYWAGAESSAAFSGGGTTDPVVLDFWDRFFSAAKQEIPQPRIIDIASGNGAVAQSALRNFSEGMPPVTCLDISASAIRVIEQRFPGVSGIVADAADPPFDAGSFDIVTSQYGVEYAGPDAIFVIADLVASGGYLALLLHHSQGLIHAQCEDSLAAIQDMQDAAFLPHCVAMFKAAYAMLDGGDKAAYQEAGRRLAPAIRAMEDIMGRYGRDVAANTIVRLYRDVRTIHGRLRQYEPSSVIEWLEKMQGAVDAYKGRMASMLDVGLDADRFGSVAAALTSDGFVMERAAELGRGNAQKPLAWALIARRN